MSDPMTEYLGSPPMKKPPQLDREAALAAAAQSFRAPTRGLRPMTPRDLLAEASRLWAVQRKKSIDGGARRVLARVSTQRLLALFETVAELVNEQNWDWEIPTATSDEEIRQFTAWSIACLRWYHWAQRDAALDFNLTLADAEVWIAAHRPTPLCLFSSV